MSGGIMDSVTSFAGNAWAAAKNTAVAGYEKVKNVVSPPQPPPVGVGQEPAQLGGRRRRKNSKKSTKKASKLRATHRRRRRS